MEQSYWSEKHFSFFCNRECEYFPCHRDVAEEDFNCLFCFCPLYGLGDQCGGAFTYLENGVKDCSGCLVPHKRENYGYIMEKTGELIAKAAKDLSR